mgnify:CR=1 FL=1
MSYIDEIYEVWQIVFQNICEKKGQSFANLWFKDLKINSFTNNTVVFSSDSEFKYSQLKENHLPLLENEFSHFMPCKVDIVFTGTSTRAENITDSIMSEEQKKPNISRRVPLLL